MAKSFIAKNRSKIYRYLSIVCFIIIGFLIGVIFVEQVDKFIIVNLGEGRYLLFASVLMISIVVSVFAQIIIHEAGHLVFGLLSGYKFSSFRIGSLMLMKSDGKYILKRFSLPGTGGQCLMSPPEIENGRLKYKLFLLGGSIMNILAGLLFIVPYLMFSDIAYVSVFFVVLSLVGFIFGVMNGIPFSSGLVNNDGYTVLKLGKSSEALYSYWVSLKVAENIAKGVRIKDMPEEWFIIRNTHDIRNSLVLSRAVLRANRLIDEHRFEEAENYINNLLTSRVNMAGIYEIVLNNELLYCELVGKARKEEIEIIFDNGVKAFLRTMKNVPSTLRTMYSYEMLYNNDMDAAIKYKEKFEKIADSYPYKEEIDGERELMDIADEIRKYRMENE